ncbi:35589_t:CDS:2, partial [Racocetra persica]
DFGSKGFVILSVFVDDFVSAAGFFVPIEVDCVDCIDCVDCVFVRMEVILRESIKFECDGLVGVDVIVGFDVIEVVE